MANGWWICRQRYDSCSGWDGADVKFHHMTQNNKQFITYELFSSRIFHLIFLKCRYLKWQNAKPRIKDNYCHLLYCLCAPWGQECAPLATMASAYGLDYWFVLNPGSKSSVFIIWKICSKRPRKTNLRKERNFLKTPVQMLKSLKGTLPFPRQSGQVICGCLGFWVETR